MCACCLCIEVDGERECDAFAEDSGIFLDSGVVDIFVVFQPLGFMSKNRSVR